MGNAQCAGRKRNDDKSKQETTTFQSSFTFTLIWLDDEQRKKPKLKRCLKEIDRQIIKFDGSDSCETYIRERPTAHFILIVCHKLGNVLVPEIDELPQLDSVFIYDFLSNDVYKSWMKQCQKVTHFCIIEVIWISFFISRLSTMYLLIWINLKVLLEIISKTQERYVDKFLFYCSSFILSSSKTYNS